MFKRLLGEHAKILLAPIDKGFFVGYANGLIARASKAVTTTTTPTTAGMISAGQ